MTWIDDVLAADAPPEPEPADEPPYVDPFELELHGRFAAVTAPWVRLGANCMPSTPGTKAPVLAGWGDTPGKSGAWLARDWGLNKGGSLHSPGSPKIPASKYDEWQIRFREHNALIFPATIGEGCMVVDVDDLSLLDKVIAACGPTDYRTISGRPGGGVHLWYSGTTHSKTGIVPGVDVKSSRGYVIAPGSLHERTGREYRASDVLGEALRGARTFDPPVVHHDWRARLTNLASGLERPTRLDLQALATALKSNVKKKDVGKRLEMVGRGQEFAEPGQRDGVLFRLLAELAQWWPNAETDSIVSLFGPSAALMERGHEVKIPIADAIRTKWERLTAQRAAQLDAAALRQQAQRAVAWALVDEQRHDMADPTAGPLVVHKGRSYYVRIGEHWHGPVSREDIGADMIAALRALYGIDAADFTGLMVSFGQPLREIRVSLSESVTVLRGGVLSVAAAPRRRLEPEYSETVARGLRLICGDERHLDLVEHWIAGLTRQDQPCRALILSGPKGAGKSLLLAGLGRLWVHGAVKMRHVLGRRFNDEAMRSPFAVADDDSEAAEDGAALAGHLRQAVSDREQRVEAKFADIARVHGCMRFAVATNDPMDIVQGAVSHKLNDESVAAFADRLLHIPVQAAARGWWRHGTREGEREDERNDRLVEGDEIARHALWLAGLEKHQKPRERFWVGAADESLHALAVLSSGLRGDILLRLAEGGAPGVKPSNDGQAWHVTTIDFVNDWRIDRPRSLGLRSGGLALKALSQAVPGVIQPASGTKKIYAISAPLVTWYASHCGVA